jgi:dimethylhistidine N-methyltransferase
MTATYTPPSTAVVPQQHSLRATILDGLRSTPKTLPATLFYDERGAALFEEICTLPEYYLTRTEESILGANAAAIATLMGSRVALIELGSGAATKVRPLLAAMQQPLAYIPVDVSREQLMDVAAERAREFPHLQVIPVWADYTEGVHLPSLPADARRVAFFPGSTIGNLHPTEASAFLRTVRALVGAEGGMVLGVDRRKNTDALHAAYNDAKGVTAAFNLNMLEHLNRAFHGNFDLTAFRHAAHFNSDDSRIEMHLQAVVAHTVRVAGDEFYIDEGESIRTEVSYKYDRARLDAVAQGGGWRVEQVFTDAHDQFWVAWLRPV